MIFSLLILINLTISNMFNQVQLPDVWNSDFTISISHSGSMRGGSTSVMYTYNQCTYKYNSDSGRPIEYTFTMTESFRKQVLAKMHELNVDKIKSLGGTFAVNDGWSQSICFGFACIEGGTSAEMSDDDKNKFLLAYNYLHQFAVDRKPR